MINRYSRQILLPEIGEKGQKKLSESLAVAIGDSQKEGYSCPISLKY